MLSLKVASFILFIVSQVYGNDLVPALSDPSTSDPYEIYLVNTFPLEIQTIDNYQNNESLNFYSKLVDQKIGTPFYAGLNRAESRKIYIESFFNHFRTLNSTKKTFISSEICQANTSTAIIPNNRRIVSIFHELNLPFEIPCFTCQTSTTSAPNFFRIVNNRKIFAYDILSESSAVYDFVKRKFENENETQIYVGAISSDGIFQWSPRLSSEKFVQIGNYKHVLSNPLTKVSENSMSLFCSKEENGNLNSPEIIVNVDTLRIPLNENSTLSNKSCNLFSSKDVHRFIIGDLAVWKDHEKTSTFPKVNAAYNLKVDIYWEKWSCCSACCCSEITCGSGYKTNSESCAKISSHKIRRGFLSFFKIDPQKPLNILSSIEMMFRGTEFYNEKLEEAVETFDIYLSSAPYVFSGIPVHSTLLQSDYSWLILELFLNKHFQYRNELKTFGQLGLIIDSRTCENDPQKQNCTVLQQCFDNELLEYDYIPPTIIEEENTVAPPFNPYQSNNHRKPIKSDTCNYKDVEDILLKEKDTVLDVDEGLSFRFAIDESEYGELLSTKWKAGQGKISEFDSKKSCSAQRIFTDGNYLMIIKVESPDTNLPYNAKGTLKSTGEEILLKLSLTFKPKAKPSKHTESILKWVGIAGGVLAAFIIVVVIVHIIQVRSLKNKLKQAAAATATTAEQI